MLYTGVDLVELARIEQAVGRWGERFLRRVYTANELNDCQGRVSSLAARWAAKEAAAKALGVGVQGFGAADVVGAGIALRWTDLEVRRAEHGRPQLVLHGGAVQRAVTLHWHSVSLSLAHGRDYAVAFVVAQAAALDPSLAPIDPLA